MNTNIHGLIHKKNANDLPYINKFYNTLLSHVNTQTNLNSLHTFKTNIYTHSDKKNHALQTGIHTPLHTII